MEPIGTRKPKRIVTGLREDGISYFARVEDVEEIDYAAVYPDSPPKRPPGSSQSHRMWAWDQLPTLPTDGLAPLLERAVQAEDTPTALSRTSAFPPVGGARINLIKFPPLAPGDPVKPGKLHWHDTVNLQWLIEGELVILLDDGNEVTMYPGDLVIQHGTNHAWEVRTEKGAVLAVVILSTERTGISPPVAEKHSGIKQPVAAEGG
jgi:hypothetical protein